jgi:hypothetical protein
LSPDRRATFVKNARTSVRAPKKSVFSWHCAHQRLCKNIRIKPL